MTPCSSAFLPLNETCPGMTTEQNLCSSFLYVAHDIEIFRNVVDGLLVVVLGSQTLGCSTDCDRSESVLICPVVSDFLRLHGLQSIRLLCPWDSPGKNPGVGCHSLLQGMFLTRGLNLGLLPCRQILYRLSHQGSKSSVFLRWRRGGLLLYVPFQIRLSREGVWRCYIWCLDQLWQIKCQV